MQIKLESQVYGKSSVRLTKVSRRPDRHELSELAIDIALEGDFAESYLVGDNRRVVATDTMKNTVYALAADHPLESPESFAITLADWFVERNAHVTAATIDAKENNWKRIETATGVHRHSFRGGGEERRTCRVRRSREGITWTSGLAGLPLLKTTDSAFKDFVRDEFTTLPDVDDRIFATLLNATWTYDRVPPDWNIAHARVVAAMIGVFADHFSLAVQQTLYAMGAAALEAVPEITTIRLEMPNQHRIPFNVQPLGKAHRNEIFVTTAEPYGLITAVLTREAN